MYDQNVIFIFQGNAFWRFYFYLRIKRYLGLLLSFIFVSSVGPYRTIMLICQLQIDRFYMTDTKVNADVTTNL